MVQRVDSGTEDTRTSGPKKAGVVLVAAIAIGWFLVLGFYALAGAAVGSISTDRSPAGTMAAVMTLCLGGIGLAASVRARQADNRHLVRLALAVMVSGLSGMTWIAAVGGSVVGWPVALLLSAAAATLLFIAFAPGR
jgi:hypothetical protein